MMAKVVTATNNCIDIFVTVWHYHLEWAEKLSATKLKLFDKLFQGNLDSCRFKATVDFRNAVRLGKRLTSKEKFSARKFANFINVLLDFLIIPCQHRPNGKIFKIASASQFLYLFEKTLFDPVLVSEDNRLRRTFLT